MNAPNPEIEAQLDELAELCVQAIKGKETDIASRTDSLLKALVMSGYSRLIDSNLRQEVESRAKSKCPEVLGHRGAELAGMTKKFQEKLEELLRWETEQPEKNTAPTVANISSATER